jgi:hypothetical protein
LTRTKKTERKYNMKPIKYKKGDESFGVVIKIALGIVILLIAFNIIWYLITGQSVLQSLFKQYIDPQIEDNAYFAATTVSFGNLDEMKTKYGCRLESANVYSCNKNAEVEIIVNIKNTGALAIPVYARPRIGNDCDADAKCSGEAWLAGNNRCFVYDNKQQNCTVGYRYTFDNADTEFRIYPGAYMKKEDYLELTKELITTDKIVYNKNSWMILKTRN